ncbi:hypothetical protein JCM8547_002640 [Rhodosporidiobolus lusitaniae]
MSTPLPLHSPPARVPPPTLPISAEPSSNPGNPHSSSPLPHPQQGRSRWNWYNRPAQVSQSTRLVVKNHFIACVGEFVGTATFLFFALGGTNVANVPDTSVTGTTGAVAAPNTSNLLYISLSFGFSLAVTVWIFFRISGGLFNPAVTLAFLLVGAATPVRAALLTISQLLGAIVGAALISGLTPGPLYALTTLADGTTISRGMFLEMFATFLLLLAILFLAAEKHRATFLAPIGIGLALFVAELTTVFYTGGSLNPARSFGPSVVMGDFPGYHWIYWVSTLSPPSFTSTPTNSPFLALAQIGPCLGAALAAAFYRFLKWMQFETVMSEKTHSTELDADGGGEGQLEAPRTELLGEENEQARRRREKKDGKKTQGPGVPDLLTGSPTEAQAAYSLPTPPSSPTSDARLDRIEHLLAQLVHSSTGVPPGTASSSGTRDYRPSIGETLVEEREREEEERKGGKAP